MTLKPNLSTRLGSEFNQQCRKVNSYHRLEPLLLFFLSIDTAWTEHKITIFFSNYLAKHSYWLMSITPHSLFLWHSSLREFFNSAFLKFAFLYTLLYDGSWAMEVQCLRTASQSRDTSKVKGNVLELTLPQQNNISAHYQCCFQAAVYGT